MTIRRRLARLERRHAPQERVTLKVYMPHPGEPEEVRLQTERELAEAEARGERVFRVRFLSPRDEPCD